MMFDKPKIILASTSYIRRQLLNDAGVEFEAKNSNLDEEMVKIGLRENGLKPHEQAHELAKLKAFKLSRGNDDFVIGCDQILSLEGQEFDKAASMDEARERLKTFRGKSHNLETAITILKNGQMIWRHDASPRLQMRNFSDEFLEYYLEKSGEQILKSVGCYQLEGMGIQLFDKIEGDYFSILGLPLLELMSYLRLHKLVEN